MITVEKATPEKFRSIFSKIQSVIVGGKEASILILVAILARGHVLIEDIPGVGKTLLAHALARATNLSFSRIQCTPDILPSDMIGFSLYDINTGLSKYMKGAVMSNIVLVDEINRASPKSQSCLLEVMEEYQATVDGVTHKVPLPFTVIATQNPIEYVGTSPLPEAQLDRFMLRFSLGYPTNEQEIEMLGRFKSENPLDGIVPDLEQNELAACQKYVDELEVSAAVRKYIVAVVRRTREHPQVQLGASPRSELALMRASMALAFLKGENFVSPDDVKALAKPVLSHRIILSSRAASRHNAEASNAIIDDVLKSVPVPTR